MNERQAEQEGYQFTGHYSHDRNEQKANAKKIREETGYSAIVVNTPTSKLSRGSHEMGYSVYAEKKYFLKKSLDSYQQRLSAIPTRMADAEIAYQEALSKIRIDEQNCKDQIADLELKLS